MFYHILHFTAIYQIMFLFFLQSVNGLFISWSAWLQTADVDIRPAAFSSSVLFCLLLLLYCSFFLFLIPPLVYQVYVLHCAT